MRVLFIVGAFPPMKCGVGDYAAYLVSGLEKLPGIIPGVLTSVGAEHCQNPPASFFPAVTAWSFSQAGPKLRAVIETFRPDVIHLQYPATYGKVLFPNFIPLLCNRRIPMVQTWHEHPIYTQLINAIPRDTVVVVDPQYPSEYKPAYRAALRHKSFTNIPVGSSIQRTELSAMDRSAYRIRYHAETSRFVVCFGFARPYKGYELLFNVLDPDKDRLVLVCDLDSDDQYHRLLLRLTESPRWQGKCFVTGFLPSEEVARILAAADAVVLPFTDGTTPRNTSVLAARVQGTFIITTHTALRGYNASEHTYYVAPGSVDGIREALDSYAGMRFVGEPCVASWDDIAVQHVKLYERVIAGWYGKSERA